jgi:peroxiredoxin
VVRPSDYRQRRNLVLAFLGHPAELRALPLLHELQEHYPSFQAATAEVLAVLRGPAEEAEALREGLRLPFPVLADPEGRAHRAYGATDAGGGPRPAVFVADRFGEVYFAQRTAERASHPTARDLLGWVDYIELQCPE